MSLGITITGPEGVVLASESRISISGETINGRQIPITFDNATKLLVLSEPHTHVGAVTYGLAAIEQRTAHSYMPEFEAELSDERASVKEYSERLSAFFMKQWEHADAPTPWAGPSMTFLIGGFAEAEAYGEIWKFEIPQQPSPSCEHKAGQFGVMWGGQLQTISRLIHGVDPRIHAVLDGIDGLTGDVAQAVNEAVAAFPMRIPLDTMPLQDCVDLAIFLIRTTIAAQRLTIDMRGCGGPIDVATITRRNGLEFVQRKTIVGERHATNAENAN